jgi:hypothetical protein
MSIKKVKVSVAGVAEDISFNGRDGGKIECYQAKCNGTVDGANAEFYVKVFGKGSASKIKAGLEFNGEFSEYQGNTIYTLKKSHNPELFAQSSGSFGGGYKGGGRTFTPQHELNALKVAEKVVLKAYEDRLSTVGLDEIADAIIKLARDKFVPYLKATTERHDTAVARDEAKALRAATIRKLIESNDLVHVIQQNRITNGTLAATYEEAGSDATRFVDLIKTRYRVNHQESAEEYADDGDVIPF